MGFVAEEIKVAVAGILLVGLAALLANVLSRILPASSSLYFFLWAFVLVPVILLVVGAFGARAAYYACMSPNQSIALAVSAALVSAIGGTILWMLASPVAPGPDFIGEYLFNRDIGGYIELVPLLIVYALSGAIGGVYDYYISRGRQCEIDRNKKGRA
ncbi:MAG: hypothetical protein A4E28_01252 [Methanocella sp. PtaU1.Bin125]|nr:MAG: hypothetical protein A4E28_01252 [Methanocella sp. PtaU1.Bin125]